MSASATMLVTIAAILAGLAAWRLVDTWLKYRGRMVVTCPKDKLPAGVSIDVRHAAATSFGRAPEVRLADCSHWPEYAGCGQQCLQQIEKSPQNCLVRNILLQWYQGKNCAWCGTPIGDIHLAERKPALMTADRVSLEWADIPAESLQQTLAIALPLCFGCHIVNTMVRKHPELVIDRARPMMIGTSHSPRTGSRLAGSRPRNQHQPDNLVGVVTREVHGQGCL